MKRKRCVLCGGEINTEMYGFATVLFFGAHYHVHAWPCLKKFRERYPDLVVHDVHESKKKPWTCKACHEPVGNGLVIDLQNQVGPTFFHHDCYKRWQGGGV